MQSLKPPTSDCPSQSSQPSASGFGGTVLSIRDRSLYYICIVKERPRDKLPDTFTTHYLDQTAFDPCPSAAWVVREEHAMGSPGQLDFDNKLISVFGKEYTKGRFLYCDPLPEEDHGPSATAEKPSMDDNEQFSSDEGSPADVEDIMTDQPESPLEEDRNEGSSSDGDYHLSDDESSGSDDNDTAGNTCEPVGLWIGLKSGEVGHWNSILRKGNFKSTRSSGLFEIWTLLPKDNQTREKPKTPDSSSEHCAHKQPTDNQQADQPR